MHARAVHDPFLQQENPRKLSHARSKEQCEKGRLKKSWRQEEARFSKFPSRVSQIYVLHYMIDHEGKISLEKVFLAVATLGLCKA